jgi:protein gp37
MEKILVNFDIPKNVWLWVTIESNKYLERINCLKRLNCKTKFLSLEPLLSEMDLINLEWIDWVIVWWESWFWARPVKEEWVLNIREKCEQLKIPFFFKQWGGVNKKKAWKLLQGRIYEEFPSKDLVAL